MLWLSNFYEAESMSRARSQPMVYLGADHGGVILKAVLARLLRADGYEVLDCGDGPGYPRDDYPLFAALVAGRVAGQPGSRGILVCRSAAGMVMAAGKVPGIRVAMAVSTEMARLARQDEDINVLALPGDWLTPRQAAAIVRQFLSTPTSQASRHHRRRAQLARLEQPQLEVLPGIFQASAASANRRVSALAPLSPWLHIDVADGQFVPARAWADPRTAAKPTAAAYEVHLMVTQPVDYLAAWRRAGAQRFIAHLEAPGLPDFIRTCQRHGYEYGIALNLGSRAEHLRRYRRGLRQALVMGVPAGRSGQPFDPAALTVVSELREGYPRARIAVDGGVSDQTALAIAAAGANRVVATSFLSRSRRPAAAIAALARPGGRDG